MRGSESIDFLHRISTNDLLQFPDGQVRFTLLVSDKGRIIDAAWIVHRNDHVLILLSKGTAEGTILWLNRYIIMEDIALTNVSSEYSVTIFADKEKGHYHTEYFGHTVSFNIDGSSPDVSETSIEYERWRIDQGIPKIGHEIVQDYNPLELNLWNWISFTKGCYIGQEVIARLDTYNKVQRTLCKFSSGDTVLEQTILCDTSGNELGKITSVISDGSDVVGLAMLRSTAASTGSTYHLKDSDKTVKIEKVFRKE